MSSSKVLYRLLNKYSNVYCKHGSVNLNGKVTPKVGLSISTSSKVTAETSLKCIRKSYFPKNMMSTMAAPTHEQKSISTFEDILPGIINDVVSKNKFSDIPDVGVWLEKVLNYNVSGGKKNRGKSTVFAYEMLEKPENITPETMRLAGIMGWCVELMQSYLIVLDDIMDGSVTRRGTPCWYRLPNVGLSAINDALLIQSTIHATLKRHFRDKKYYSDVLDLFNEVLFNTASGQHLDWMTANRDKSDFNLFTMDRYNSIVKYKTAYYTYQLPVGLALFMSNNQDAEAHKRAEEICLEIGQIFQIQDDYIDCYGNPAYTGKVGTDIQEGKCTWLAVSALQLCSSEQRQIMATHYGLKEPAHVENIKNLYEDLGLQKKYLEHEKLQYDTIRQHIKQLPGCLSQDLFVKLIDQIYQRKH